VPIYPGSRLDLGGFKSNSSALRILTKSTPDAAARKIRRQTTASPASIEAVEAMAPGVEISPTGLWAEFMHQPHNYGHVLDNSKPALSWIQHGMGSGKVASYKLVHFYVEYALDKGLIWLDFISGAHCPSDLLTKSIANIAEFDRIVGIINGSAPYLYKSSPVRKILEGTMR